MHQFYNYLVSKFGISKLIFLILLLFFSISFLSYAENNQFISHEVQKGENLWGISKKYHISVESLQSINKIDKNDILSIGQMIKIPQVSFREIDSIIHHVKKGETLWALSRKYGVDLNSIIKSNNLRSSDLIVAGQTIIIPNIQKKNITEKLTEQELDSKNDTIEEVKKPVVYSVKKGDTLWKIAREYGVSIASIKEINQLVNDDVLSVNQKLEIPGMGGGLTDASRIAQASIITYTVIKGDTLWTISRKFDAKMSSIISLNNLKEISRLSIGQKIKIPIANMDIAKAEGYDENAQVQEIIYYVKKGENLWNISRDYNVKLETIIAANNISDASNISTGQRLIIPKVPGIRSSICNFIWPTKGRITSAYGTRFLNGHKEFHSGIDIACPSGTNIVAAENGKVSYSGYMRGYGNVIILSHPGGYSTVYAHNSVNLVKKGQVVKKGSLIGKIGRTGNATGPHIHFEIRLNGKPRDPSPYLN